MLALMRIPAPMNPSLNQMGGKEAEAEESLSTPRDGSVEQNGQIEHEDEAALTAPTAPTEPILFRAALEKKGGGKSFLGRRNWKTRHFVLRRGVLTWYKTEKEMNQKVKEAPKLVLTELAGMQDATDLQRPLTILLEDGEREGGLMTRTMTQARYVQWRQALNAHRDFANAWLIYEADMGAYAVEELRRTVESMDEGPFKVAATRRLVDQRIKAEGAEARAHQAREVLAAQAESDKSAGVMKL